MRLSVCVQRRVRAREASLFFSVYCCALKAVEPDFVLISVLDNEVFNALTLGNIFAQFKEIELHSLAEFNGYNTLCFATVVRFNSDLFALGKICPEAVFYKFTELAQPLDIVIIKSELICVRLYMSRLLEKVLHISFSFCRLPGRFKFIGSGRDCQYGFCLLFKSLISCRIF